MNAEIIQEIAGRLLKIRKINRLNQKEFAQMLEISLRAYQNYERGENEISAGCILALRSNFGINANWLLTGYRTLVGKIVMTSDANEALQNMRCWWSEENKLRIAADMPEHEGRAFLGR